jgi:flagellar motility protein MotE (MotC chaperone)
MTKLPRLLPLVAVAAAGVLAVNALENGPGVIGAARSFAEGTGSSKAASESKAQAKDIAPPASGGDAPQVVAAKPAPVCAESAAQIARDAGLSPAELQVLQSLSTRRGELDQREQGLDTQLALIQAAEAKVDAKIATMNALKAQMQGMLGQLDAKQQAEVDRLVKVFEAMKPADAAARFVLLNDDVRLPIAAQMKERSLSAMLAKMPPAEAKRLTESLAARFLAQANAARQTINPPAAQPAPQTAQASPPATAAPDQTAATQAQAGPAPKKAPVHHKRRPPAAPPAQAKASGPAGAASGGAKPQASADASAAKAKAPVAPSATPPASTPPASGSAPAAAPSGPAAKAG